MPPRNTSVEVAPAVSPAPPQLRRHHLSRPVLHVALLCSDSGVDVADSARLLRHLMARAGSSAEDQCLTFSATQTLSGKQADSVPSFPGRRMSNNFVAELKAHMRMVAKAKAVRAGAPLHDETGASPQSSTALQAGGGADNNGKKRSTSATSRRSNSVASASAKSGVPKSAGKQQQQQQRRSVTDSADARKQADEEEAEERRRFVESHLPACELAYLPNSAVHTLSTLLAPTVSAAAHAGERAVRLEEEEQQQLQPVLFIYELNDEAALLEASHMPGVTPPDYEAALWRTIDAAVPNFTRSRFEDVVVIWAISSAHMLRAFYSPQIPITSDGALGVPGEASGPSSVAATEAAPGAHKATANASTSSGKAAGKAGGAPMAANAIASSRTPSVTVAPTGADMADLLGDGKPLPVRRRRGIVPRVVLYVNSSDHDETALSLSFSDGVGPGAKRGTAATGGSRKGAGSGSGSGGAGGRKGCVGDRGSSRGGGRGVSADGRSAGGAPTVILQADFDFYSTDVQRVEEYLYCDPSVTAGAPSFVEFIEKQRQFARHRAQCARLQDAFRPPWVSDCAGYREWQRSPGTLMLAMADAGDWIGEVPPAGGALSTTASTITSPTRVLNGNVSLSCETSAWAAPTGPLDALLVSQLIAVPSLTELTAAVHRGSVSVAGRRGSSDSAKSGTSGVEQPGGNGGGGVAGLLGGVPQLREAEPVWTVVRATQRQGSGGGDAADAAAEEDDEWMNSCVTALLPPLDRLVSVVASYNSWRTHRTLVDPAPPPPPVPSAPVAQATPVRPQSTFISGISTQNLRDLASAKVQSIIAAASAPAGETHGVTEGHHNPHQSFEMYDRAKYFEGRTSCYSVVQAIISQAATNLCSERPLRLVRPAQRCDGLASITAALRSPDGDESAAAAPEQRSQQPRSFFRPYTVSLLTARGDSGGTAAVTRESVVTGQTQAGALAHDAHCRGIRGSVADNGEAGRPSSSSKPKSRGGNRSSRRSTVASGKADAAANPAGEGSLDAAKGIAQEAASVSYAIPFAASEEGEGDGSPARPVTPADVQWITLQCVRKGLGAFALDERGGGSTIAGVRDQSLSPAEAAKHQEYFQAEARLRELLDGPLGRHGAAASYREIGDALQKAMDGLARNANEALASRLDEYRGTPLNSALSGEHSGLAEAGASYPRGHRGRLCSMDILRQSAILHLSKHEEELRRSVERNLTRREREHIIQQAIFSELVRTAGLVPPDSILGTVMHAVGTTGCALVEVISGAVAYARMAAYLQRFGHHIATILTFSDDRIADRQHDDSPTAPRPQLTSLYSVSAENVHSPRRAERLWVAGLSVPPLRRQRLLWVYTAAGVPSLEQFTTATQWLLQEQKQPRGTVHHDNPHNRQDAGETRERGAQEHKQGQEGARKGCGNAGQKPPCGGAAAEAEKASSLPSSVLKQLLVRQLQQRALYLVPQHQAVRETTGSHSKHVTITEASASPAGESGNISPTTGAAGAAPVVGALPMIDNLERREALKLVAESRESLFPFCGAVVEVSSTNHSRSCRYTKSREVTATLHYSVPPAAVGVQKGSNTNSASPSCVSAAAADEVAYLVVRFDDGVTLTCTPQQPPPPPRPSSSSLAPAQHSSAGLRRPSPGSTRQPPLQRSHSTTSIATEEETESVGEREEFGNSIKQSVSKANGKGRGKSARKANAGAAAGRSSSSGGGGNGGAKGRLQSSGKRGRGVAGTGVGHAGGGGAAAAAAGSARHHPPSSLPYPIGADGCVRLWTARLSPAAERTSGGPSEAPAAVVVEPRKAHVLSSSSSGGILPPGKTGGTGATATGAPAASGKKPCASNHLLRQSTARPIRPCDVSVASGTFALFAKDGEDALWMHYIGVGGDSSRGAATVVTAATAKEGCNVALPETLRCVHEDHGAESVMATSLELEVRRAVVPSTGVVLRYFHSGRVQRLYPDGTVMVSWPLEVEGAPGAGGQLCHKLHRHSAAAISAALPYRSVCETLVLATGASFVRTVVIPTASASSQSLSGTNGAPSAVSWPNDAHDKTASFVFPQECPSSTPYVELTQGSSSPAGSGRAEVKASYDPTHHCHLISRGDGVCVAYYYHRGDQRQQQQHSNTCCEHPQSLDATGETTAVDAATLLRSLREGTWAGTDGLELSSMYARVTLHADGTSITTFGDQITEVSASPPVWVSPAIAMLLDDALNVSEACHHSSVRFCVEAPRMPRVFLTSAPEVSTIPPTGSPQRNDSNDAIATATRIAGPGMLSGSTAAGAGYYVVFGDGTILRRHLHSSGARPGATPANVETILSRPTHTSVRLIHDYGLAVVEPADVMASNLMNPASLAVGEGFPLFDLALGGLRLVDHRCHVTEVAELYTPFSVSVRVRESTLEELLRGLVKETYTPHRLPRAEKELREAKRRTLELAETTARAAGVCPPLQQRLRELAEEFVIAYGLLQPEALRNLQAAKAAALGSALSRAGAGGDSTATTYSGTHRTGAGPSMGSTRIPRTRPVVHSGSVAMRATSHTTNHGVASPVAIHEGGPGGGGSSKDSQPSLVADCVSPQYFVRLANGEVVQHVDKLMLNQVLHEADCTEADPVFMSRSIASGEPGVQQLTLFRVPTGLEDGGQSGAPAGRPPAQSQHRSAVSPQYRRRGGGGNRAPHSFAEVATLLAAAGCGPQGVQGFGSGTSRAASYPVNPQRLGNPPGGRPPAPYDSCTPDPRRFLFSSCRWLPPSMQPPRRFLNPRGRLAGPPLLCETSSAAPSSYELARLFLEFDDVAAAVRSIVLRGEVQRHDQLRDLGKYAATMATAFPVMPPQSVEEQERLQRALETQRQRSMA